jgi:hypothetical protein
MNNPLMKVTHMNILPETKWLVLSEALASAGYQTGYREYQCPSCKAKGRDSRLDNQIVVFGRGGPRHVQLSCRYSCEDLGDRLRQICPEAFTDESLTTSGNTDEDKPAPGKDKPEREFPDVTPNEWRSALASDKDISLTLKGFGMVLAQYADWTTGEHIHPGERLLEEKHGISESTSGRHFKALAKARYLYQTYDGKWSKDGRRDWSSEYRLILPN